MRRQRKAAVAISASVLASLAAAHPALANAGAYCGTPDSGHCYSVLFENDPLGYSDIRATIPSDSLQFNASPSNGEFLDGELWVNNYATNAWIETGFIKHYPDHYLVFWADNKPNCTSSCFFVHSFLYYNPDPTPANHTFEIIRTATAGHWNVWYGGVLEGTSTISGMNSSTDATIGSELWTHDSDKFYSCFGHCYNTGLGSGVWTMYALPYKNGTAHNWSNYQTYVTPSSDYHGGENATYPWLWSWYKQLQ